MYLKSAPKWAGRVPRAVAATGTGRATAAVTVAAVLLSACAAGGPPAPPPTAGNAARGAAAAPVVSAAAVSPPPAAAPSSTGNAASGQAGIPGAFADNPIIYFVITDRFVDGNPANDNSYGRKREADPKDDVGTFHGGDLKGVTQKLNDGWFQRLGVNAIWITAPYEQIHGWVVGGKNEFKHYAYHGYFGLDWTVLDKNMGTPDELREMVDTAHRQGIRILFDIVMNHAGYLDIQTAADLNIDVLWPGAVEKATLANYHRNIDYNNFAFGDWWGRPWVRAGLPGYTDGGSDHLTKLLTFLPDFRTESTEFVRLPAFLHKTPQPASSASAASAAAGKGDAKRSRLAVRPSKPDTNAVDLPNATVRGYLVKWLTDWVRDYGIDGFRCDTVKHVEMTAWAELKKAGIAALADWKAANPTKKIDDAPFWMVGEDWGHGPERSKLHDSGFDAMINFDFQDRVSRAAGKPDALFADYAKLQAGHPAQMLNYVSSHDTKLFPRDRLIEAGNALLLAPGAPQIYYGDETARPPGAVPNSDPQQATRSDMNWDKLDTAVLEHWRRLGSFRARHVALARGAHQRLGAAGDASPYVFGRSDAASGDKVVVALDVAVAAALPVAPLFADGDVLLDAYAGRHYTVGGGVVRIDAPAKAVLLERIAR